MGSLEDDVLHVLWQSERSLTVRQVLDQLNESRSEPLAYTTVMTVLSRLATKGVLVRERIGRGYTYRPVATDTASLAVRQVLDQHGTAALTHFVAHAETDPELRDRLRQLIDDDGS